MLQIFPFVSDFLIQLLNIVDTVDFPNVRDLFVYLFCSHSFYILLFLYLHFLLIYINFLIDLLPRLCFQFFRLSLISFAFTCI